MILFAVAVTAALLLCIIVDQHVSGFVVVVSPARANALRLQGGRRSTARTTANGDTTSPPASRINSDSQKKKSSVSSVVKQNQDDAAGDIRYTKDTSPSTIITAVYVAEIESLRGRKDKKFESYESEGTTEPDRTFTSSRIQFERIRGGRGLLKDAGELPTHVANVKYNQLISDGEVVLADIIRNSGGDGGNDGGSNGDDTSMASCSRAFHRAGPRRYLHFDPTTVNAAIVVAGGLCPGLNNVIRELTHSLYYLYGVNQVWGITGGFRGFHDFENYEPVLLTNELVADIHHGGGTVLRSARGGLDIDRTLQFLRNREISQLFVIGGDGTHRGAYAIHRACQDSDMNVAVACIPKTIDNDIDYIDRSFGFMSAVEAAQAGIRSAATEAKCNAPNGIGVIKLMGRSAGFLASFAALGSGDVDLVLVPEVPIVMDGKDGILPFLRKRLKEQGYAVVVVAEGAGEELLGIADGVDDGGNKKKPKIGEFICEQIPKYLGKYGEETTIKYIDPSYMVRSVPANGADSLYCMQLAQNAVHGAMAGTCLS